RAGAAGGVGHARRPAPRGAPRAGGRRAAGGPPPAPHPRRPGTGRDLPAAARRRRPGGRCRAGLAARPRARAGGADAGRDARRPRGRRATRAGNGSARVAANGWCGVTGWAVASCPGLAAVVVAWPPPRRSRGRPRRIRHASPRPAATWFLRLVRHRLRLRAVASPAATGRRRSGSSRRSLAWVAVALMAVLAGVLGGPVAAVVAGAYGAAAVRALARRAARRARISRRRELLDHLSSAAADLRAGLPVADALALTGVPAAAVAGGPLPATGGGAPRRWGTDAAHHPLVSRIQAAVALADRTGAPLADLLERIEADARAADRVGAAVAAQAAGFQATAWLLAGLPAAGLALGYAIAADPLRVLLHTPVGAACAVTAVGLQLAGLGWTRRLMRAAEAGA